MPPAGGGEEPGTEGGEWREKKQRPGTASQAPGSFATPHLPSATSSSIAPFTWEKHHWKSLPPPPPPATPAGDGKLREHGPSLHKPQPLRPPKRPESRPGPMSRPDSAWPSKATCGPGACLRPPRQGLQPMPPRPAPPPPCVPLTCHVARRVPGGDRRLQKPAKRKNQPGWMEKPLQAPPPLLELLLLLRLPPQPAPTTPEVRGFQNGAHCRSA